MHFQGKKVCHENGKHACQCLMKETLKFLDDELHAKVAPTYLAFPFITSLQKLTTS